ncbi:hypothetical protein [Lysinibacillus xylanilyticus]|uniref:hypothetical protein n=1 Tax=Lysinibacillus xylanilyticus TaxID=582475 RepID=UPI003D0826B7
MRESEATAADVFCAKAKRQRQQHDVGHSGIFTGCEALSLSSSISADVWTPAEKLLKTTFISPSIEAGDFCS